VRQIGGARYGVLAGGVGVVVLSALVLSVVYSGRGSNSISSSNSSSSEGSPAVVKLVGEFVKDLNNGTVVHDQVSVKPLEGFYSNTSVVKWYGTKQNDGFYASAFFTGVNRSAVVYGGRYNIIGLYSVVVNNYFFAQPKPAYASLIASNLSTRVVAPNTVNATFSLFVKVWNSAVGAFNATINVQQQWVNQAGSWYIQRESWDFLKSYVQSPMFIGN